MLTCNCSGRSKPLDLKSPPWPKISDAAKDCVRKMLARDPRKRLTAEEVSLLVEYLLAGSEDVCVHKMFARDLQARLTAEEVSLHIELA
eukprot:1147374-Pelagomonas_calceolata.AAC.6